MASTLQTRSEGRQDSRFAMAEFTFADFPTTAFVPCIKIPANAAIVGGYLGVKTASGAALTLSLGTSGSAASLLAATSVAAQGKTAFTAALTNYGCPTAAGQVIGITPSAGTPTLLAGVVVIEYIVSGRSETTES
jgi:hypothetical protein